MEQACRYQRPVVYELDDLLTELPPEHVDWEYYRTARLPLLRAIVEADAVTASTRESVRLPAFCTIPMPGCCPTISTGQLWTFQPTNLPPAGRSPVVIGYMGGHTYASDLEMVAPPLVRVLERHKARSF